MIEYIAAQEHLIDGGWSLLQATDIAATDLHNAKEFGAHPDVCTIAQQRFDSFLDIADKVIKQIVVPDNELQPFGNRKKLDYSIDDPDYQAALQMCG